MTLPNALKNTLAVPAIGAPMFLVSFPPLVTALCRAGVIGAFPHVNARPSKELDRWLTDIEADLRAHKKAHPAAKVAPHAVNLIVHRTNTRYEPDLEIVASHKVPLVITCLGDPRRAIEAVHGYGGIVFCDVVNALHARKAI
ncbi:MAG: nitronate monooxygenase, partial [Xanthobacteraceae bacterium]